MSNKMRLRVIFAFVASLLVRSARADYEFAQKEAEILSSSSICVLLGSLAFNFIVAGVFISMFFVLRKAWRIVYEPKTLQLAGLPVSRRTAPLAWDPPRWLSSLAFEVPTSQVLAKTGIDAYMFVRYLQMMLALFGVTLVFAWPILMPLNSAGNNSETVAGIDKISFGAVDPNKLQRYWAHLVLAYAFVGWFIFLVHREMSNYIQIVQAYCAHEGFQKLNRSRAMLVLNVPKKLLSVDALMDIYGRYPGGVRKIWLNRQFSELLKLVEERVKYVTKLEKIWAKITRNTCCKACKQQKCLQGKRKKMESASSSATSSPSYNAAGASSDIEKQKLKTTDLSIQQLGLKRPKIKIGAKDADKCRRSIVAPCGAGKRRVDAIEYYSDRIKALSDKITDMKANEHNFELMNSAFVEFNTREGLLMASQTLSYFKPLQLQPVITDVSEKDIIWPNLRMVWWQWHLRYALACALIILLILVAAIPTLIIIALGQYDMLARVYFFAAAYEIVPWPVISFLQGTLPPLLLLCVVSLFPFIIRKILKVTGMPTKRQIDSSLQNFSFAFSFIQTFVVVALGGASLTIYAGSLEDPKSIPDMIAARLPRTSNFFVTYLLMQGVTGSSWNLLNLPGIKKQKTMNVLDRTPRNYWQRRNVLASIGLTAAYPKITVLACITIIYSLITPLVLIFALIGFALMFLQYKYDLIYVATVNDEYNGMGFSKAIHQTFTGVYMLEISLIVLFFLREETYPQGSLIIVLLIITAAYQTQLAMRFDPFVHNSAVVNPTRKRIGELAVFANAHADSPLAATSIRSPSSTNSTFDDSTMVDPSFKTTQAMFSSDIEKSDSFETVKNAMGTIGTSSEAVQNTEKSSVKKSSRQLRRFVLPVDIRHPDGARELTAAMDNYLEPFSKNTRDSESSHGYVHEAVAAVDPVAWFAKLPENISHFSELDYVQFTDEVQYSTEGASLREDGKIEINGFPPDLPEAKRVELQVNSC